MLVITLPTVPGCSSHSRHGVILGEILLETPGNTPGKPTKPREEKWLQVVLLCVGVMSLPGPRGDLMRPAGLPPSGQAGNHSVWVKRTQIALRHLH